MNVRKGELNRHFFQRSIYLSKIHAGLVETQKTSSAPVPRRKAGEEEGESQKEN